MRLKVGLFQRKIGGRLEAIIIRERPLERIKKLKIVSGVKVGIMKGIR
jgi:hypothetical protein